MRLSTAFFFACCLFGILHLSAAEAPRAARSVHLGYNAPTGDVFYTEMVVERSVNGSYFMACGWDTGYFGIQQLNHPTNKVVIFSVWDPTKGDNPGAVQTGDRVENLFAGEGVRIRRFGGEGTGGQSMAPFSWKPGETNRFLIHATVQSNKTAYTAWIYDPGQTRWRKLATFRTRTGGRLLRGYYSFVEDFRRDTRSVNEVRRARFGNGWVRASDGKWSSLASARFTASNARWEAKENINAGVVAGWFYLATGGDTRRETELRSTLRLPERDRSGEPPALPF
jgi:hypothetical protein